MVERACPVFPWEQYPTGYIITMVTRAWETGRSLFTRSFFVSFYIAIVVLFVLLSFSLLPFSLAFLHSLLSSVSPYFSPFFVYRLMIFIRMIYRLTRQIYHLTCHLLDSYFPCGYFFYAPLFADTHTII